jgi:hypothetical protein
MELLNPQPTQDGAAWKPLLSRELAVQARDAVMAIAETLGALDLAGARSAGGGAPLPDLAWGALLFGYLARAAGSGSARHAELADLYLDEAMRSVALQPMSASLFGGFTGVAWISQHLERLGDRKTEPRAAGADAHEEVDSALQEILAQSPWPGPFDLVSGLVGIGVYALERIPRPAAVNCLAAVVDHLHASAVVDGDGLTWHTRPELLPPSQREEEPLGYFNLGVAHGVPGVVSLLADACQVGPCRARARPLLEGAVRWLLAQPRAGQAGSRFGRWVSPGAGFRPSRLAWCYGDAGVAATLLYAARTAGEPGWERAALEIASHAAEVPAAATGVEEPSLCHGALGLAHLYNRIYQASAQELFAEAARHWYRLGLDLRRPGEGIAGFCAWGVEASPASSLPGDLTLLTGAAGVGLALLAAITELAPDWDRLLRVSIPPRPAA